MTGKETDGMTKVREIIFCIFVNVIYCGHEHFQLKVKGSTDSPDWFIRAHPPVRTSPRGTPILLLSALDHHLQERLQSEGKLDISRAKKSFHRIFGHVAAEDKLVIPIESTEVSKILRYTRLHPPPQFEQNSSHVLAERKSSAWKVPESLAGHFCPSSLPRHPLRFFISLFFDVVVGH